MKYAIFATARNEKFIIEWVNYYIRLGFNYFIVYDDLSDKPIQEVFEENNIDKVIYKIYRNRWHFLRPTNLIGLLCIVNMLPMIFNLCLHNTNFKLFKTFICNISHK